VRQLMFIDRFGADLEAAAETVAGGG
jgi:hypothetical protein